MLRRLLRRAARHGKLLGIQGSFLSDLCAKVIEISGNAYPELKEKEDYIKKVIAIEESKFSSTIDQGMSIIEDYVSQMKAEHKTLLEGEKVFKLHDTYGFPLELTQEILQEQGCEADVEGFKKHMSIRKSWPEPRKNRKRMPAGRRPTQTWIWEREQLSQVMKHFLIQVQLLYSLPEKIRSMS